MKKEIHFSHKVLTPDLKILPQRIALNLFDQVTVLHMHSIYRNPSPLPQLSHFFLRN